MNGAKNNYFVFPREQHILSLGRGLQIFLKLVIKNGCDASDKLFGTIFFKNELSNTPYSFLTLYSLCCFALPCNNNLKEHPNYHESRCIATNFLGTRRYFFRHLGVQNPQLLATKEFVRSFSHDRFQESQQMPLQLYCGLAQKAGSNKAWKN